jgi:hypothetical protein
MFVLWILEQRKSFARTILAIAALILHALKSFHTRAENETAPGSPTPSRRLQSPPDEQPLDQNSSMTWSSQMVDLTQLIRQHRADAQTKQELIRREMIEDSPASIKEPPGIEYDRNEMLWQRVDPQVAKAMAYARDRMKFYERELRRKKR